jgi:L-fucose isomerase-like protein
MRKKSMRLTVGLASTPDDGGNLQRCREGLAALGDTLGFDMIVADRSLKSREDADFAARQLLDERVDLTLLLCNTFVPNGDVVLPLADVGAPLGLWALPEPTREGPLRLTSLVSLNLFASTLAHFRGGSGPRCKWFLGDVEDVFFRERLEVTVRALRVIKGLQDATIGYIGGHAPGFHNLTFGACELARTLGVRVVTLPLDVVLDATRTTSAEKARRAGRRMAERAACVAWSAVDVETVGRIYAGLIAVKEAQGFSALAVACWPGFYEHLGVFPCAAYGTLNADGVIISCEGDVMGAVSLLALALAGDDAPTLMDLVSVLPDEEAICLWHCGLATWQLADSGGVKLITRPVPQPDGEMADVGGFADVTFAPGPATIVRLSRDGRQWLVAGAQITDYWGPGYEGSGGWLNDLRMGCQSVTPVQFLDAVVRYGVEHHYAIVQGDVANVLVEAAAWLGVELVTPRDVATYV